MTVHIIPPPRRGDTGVGRWHWLVWFAKRERIMSRAELAKALERYRADT